MLNLIRLIDHLNLSLVDIERLLLHRRFPLMEARVLNLYLLLVLTTAAIASYTEFSLNNRDLLTILSLTTGYPSLAHNISIVHQRLACIHRSSVEHLRVSFVLMILSAVHEIN